MNRSEDLSKLIKPTHKHWNEKAAKKFLKESRKLPPIMRALFLNCKPMDESRQGEV